MPTLTPLFDHPLHGIIEREKDRFVLRTNAATESPFAFCEEGAVASVRSHAEYLRAIADFMEKLAEDPGFDISDWIEVEDDETTQDVGINESQPIPGTWDWAKLRMKQGHKVTRTIGVLDWHYFMNSDGEVRFAAADADDDCEVHVDDRDIQATDWRIYTGTT